MFELAKDLRATRSVMAKDSSGAPTRDFRMRGGPGHLAPLTASPNHEPCYFEFPAPIGRATLELHNSLEHKGKSGVEHELDLSIISTTDALRCRSGPTSAPYEGELLFGAELKAHRLQIGKAIARSVLGVALDLPPYGRVLAEEYWYKDESPVVERYFPIERLYLITSAPQHAHCGKLLRVFGCVGLGEIAPGKRGSSSTLFRRLSL